MEDVSLGRRAGACQTIKRVFNWATKKGYLDRNPIGGVDKPSAGKRNNVVSKKTFAKMLTLCSDQNFQDLLQFCWETACRPQEAWKLESRHIDKRHRRLILPKEETKRKKKARVIYCSQKAWVIVLRLGKNDGHLFRNAIGKPWNKNSVNNRMFAMKTSLKKKYALYDIRHTAITRMLKTGMDSHLVAKLTGTSVKMIEATYSHIEDDAKYMTSLVDNIES